MDVQFSVKTAPESNKHYNIELILLISMMNIFLKFQDISVSRKIFIISVASYRPFWIGTPDWSLRILTSLAEHIDESTFFTLNIPTQFIHTLFFIYWGYKEIELGFSALFNSFHLSAHRLFEHNSVNWSSSCFEFKSSDCFCIHLSLNVKYFKKCHRLKESSIMVLNSQKCQK